MCRKNKGCGRKIDKCMRNAISSLKIRGMKIVSCCCGHKKYPMTIVYQGEMGGIFELFSGLEIPRTRNFYKKDKNGYYYIPELQGR